MHEASDVGPRFIGSAFCLLIISLAVITLSVLWLFPLPSTDRTLHAPLPLYPEPRLQPSPRQDMERFLAEETEQLTTYGWIDKAHGVVHVPIEVAMKKLAQRGIDGWPTSPEQSANFQAAGAPAVTAGAAQ